MKDLELWLGDAETEHIRPISFWLLDLTYGFLNATS